MLKNRKYNDDIFCVTDNDVVMNIPPDLLYTQEILEDCPPMEFPMKADKNGTYHAVFVA